MSRPRHTPRRTARTVGDDGAAGVDRTERPGGVARADRAAPGDRTVHRGGSLTALAGDWPSARRATRLYQRNLLVYKHAWMVIFSGFFEPLFYLLSLGLGLAGMVNDVGGLNYTAFVAPGLLASSCMNAAVSDGFFNIWFKLNIQKTYDGILATPMRVADVAFGELLWAITRGAIYATAFLGLVSLSPRVGGPPILLSPYALLALPGAFLAAASFSAMALCLCTFVRRRENFDIVLGLVVMPMFLFSGIFFPLTVLPGALQAVVQVVPLYHAVELLRGLTAGTTAPLPLVWHTLYLAAAGLASFVVAMRRLERTLVT